MEFICLVLECKLGCGPRGLGVVVAASLEAQGGDKEKTAGPRRVSGYRTRVRRVAWLYIG